MTRVGREFFIKPTLQVAKSLLGCSLVRIYKRKKLVGKIVEVEAYIGPHDKASHAYKGKITKRNKAEFLIGGHIYIYLVYGMYWQLNITTETEGKPACVLIRALEPVEGIKEETNGPGKLCRALKLSGKFYGEDLCTSRRIWIEEGKRVKRNQIVKVPRIGIDYAGEYWTKIPWRFYIRDNKYVSRR